jgi:hypothetical protein
MPITKIIYLAATGMLMEYKYSGMMLEISSRIVYLKNKAKNLKLVSLGPNLNEKHQLFVLYNA